VIVMAKVKQQSQVRCCDEEFCEKKAVIFFRIEGLTTHLCAPHAFDLSLRLEEVCGELSPEHQERQ
jgi:hypothetical protein